MPNAAMPQTYAEIAKSPTALARYWHAEIKAAKDRRAGWRKDAEKSLNIYKQTTRADFNIHFSNVRTRASARFNSSPTVDVRPAFFDDDKPAKAAAQLTERTLTHQLDQYDFDAVIKSSVMGDEICGQGQVRVYWDTEVYTETDTDAAGNEKPVQRIKRECAKAVYVPFKDYLEGPALIWSEVPWVAFFMRWTRNDLQELGVKKVILDKLSFPHAAIEEQDEDEDSVKKDENERESECIGREHGWMIWHKATRSLIVISENLTTDVLMIDDDPVPRLPGFFPCPRPLQCIEIPGSLVPVCPYVQYEATANSLNEVTKRIQSLVRIMKYRGFRASEIPELASLETLQDGEFAPVESAMALLSQGKSLEDAFWAVPVDKLVIVLRELLGVQEYLKNVVHEVTGITEAMRGASDPNKTATAETIEANFGSLRIHDDQKEVQRFVRDILRLKSDIISAHFGAETIAKIDGVDMNNPEDAAKFEEVLSYIQSDEQRYYRVDIETDSTIQADLTKAQANATKFLDSATRFANTFVPMIAQEMMPASPVLKLFGAIAGQFKLGKQAEMAIDELLQTVAAQEEQKLAEKPQKDAENEQKRKMAEDMQMQGMAADVQKTQAEAQKAEGEAIGQEIENAQHVIMGPEEAENFVGEGG